MITAKNIKKKYNDQEVLRGIDLKIDKNEIVVILGASGSGKSTLLNILSGLEKSDSGEVIYDNESISDYSEKQWLYTKSGAWKNSSPGFQFLYAKRQISNIIKVYKNN